jgi:hypothetical protein
MSAILYAMGMTPDPNTPNTPTSPVALTGHASPNNPVSPSSPDSLTDDPILPVFSFKDKRYHRTVIVAKQSDNKFLCVHELDGVIATIEKVKAYDILKMRAEAGNPDVDSETVWLFAYLNRNGSGKAVLLEGWSHTTRYHNGNPTSLLCFAMDHTDPYPHIANQIMRCLAADGR